MSFAILHMTYENIECIVSAEADLEDCRLQKNRRF